MIFNKHSTFEGQHAFLCASKYYWINDSEEQLANRLRNSYAAEIGTILHDIARKHILYGFKLTRYDKKPVMLELLDRGIPGRVIDGLDFDNMYSNLTAYVNDAIGYRMKPEVLLFYSENCFGTTDAISYLESERLLRIHDFKSGTTAVHIEQLEIYASIFCLEYQFKPGDMEMELRIYQNNEVLIHKPKADDILPIMDKIVTFDKIVNEMKYRRD